MRRRNVIVAVVILAAGLGGWRFLAELVADRELSPLNSAFVAAVKADDLAEVTRLLDQGADVNSRDTKRYATCTSAPRSVRSPALLLTLYRKTGSGADRNPATTLLLLDRGANPNLSDRFGRTPLHFAATQGKLTLVQALLKHGARANVRKDDGDTPLINASYWGHVEVVELLIKNGADVNARGFLKFSALTRATGYRNHPKTMEVLLAQGADPNIRNKFGQTPLHYAITYARLAGIKILLQHGADVNARDGKGKTPLALAAEYTSRPYEKKKPEEVLALRTEMARILHEAGARE